MIADHPHPSLPTAATTSDAVNAAMFHDFEVERPIDPTHGPKGCYLVYEGHSGGRLMLHYSLGMVPDNAVGFWLPAPSQPIQAFKFKQAGGRSELIKGIAGGDSNRRKYFVGWCQFLKLCRAKQGRLIMFTPAQGVDVDIYGYNSAGQHPEYLDLSSGLTEITEFDAFAVVPRHAAFLKGVKTIVMSHFLELGNLAGASTSV
ncbi:hypothetical protein ACA910_022462 [Epithemia clementina (nom. ined.)]